MLKSTMLLCGALIAGALTALAFQSPVRAQAPTARPPADEAVAALTSEFRALRSELTETLRAGLRLQMLVSRLQAQEQRIMYLDRQRIDLTNRLAQAEQQRNATVANIERMTTTEVPPGVNQQNQRRDLELQIQRLKAQLQTQDLAVARLRTEEAQASSALGMEQGRWSDFNSRLDDLERALR